MLNLLHANFKRLVKSKLFYIFSILMFLIVAFYSLILKIYSSNGSMGNSVDLFFISFPSISLIPTIGIAVSVMGSVFLGQDFNYGTIKNKIIMGKTRIEIYLSSLITVFVAGVFFYLSYYLAVFTIGMITIGNPLVFLDKVDVIKLMLYQLLLVLTYSSIATAITFITKNMTASVVILIIFSVVLMTVGYSLIARLNEPEFWYNENGSLIYNEGYISGTKRVILTFIVNFFPSCQSCYFMLNPTISEMSLGIMSTYLLFFFIISSSLGILLFSKTDLK